MTNKVHLPVGRKQAVAAQSSSSSAEDGDEELLLPALRVVLLLAGVLFWARVCAVDKLKKNIGIFFIVLYISIFYIYIWDDV